MRTSLPSCSAEAAALRPLIYIHSSCLDSSPLGPPRRPEIRTAAVVNPLTGFPTSVWLEVASRECHDAFLWSLGDARTCHLERTSLIPRESITPIHRTRKKAEKRRTWMSRLGNSPRISDFLIHTNDQVNYQSPPSERNLYL